MTAPTSHGNVAVYPGDASTRPTVSNLNYGTGQTVANLVIVQVGANGKVDLTNSSKGTIELVADALGYFTGDASQASAQGAFGAVRPTRLLDTRSGLGGTKGPVAADGVVHLKVTGGSIPNGVSAVVLTVTVTAPTAAGYVTVYPYGSKPPRASNINFVRGNTVPNLVVAPVAANGVIDLRSVSSGTSQLLADVSGYFVGGDPTASGDLGSLAPSRLLDTRSGIGISARAVGAHATATFSVSGRGGVPLKPSVTAVPLNVTVTDTTASGYLTVYAGGTKRPTASNLNFTRGRTVANLDMAPVGAAGTVSIYNGSAGTVQLVADVSGYVSGRTVTVPAVSVSRYVRKIADIADPSVNGEGCAEAHAKSTLVLLDIGAQLNDTTGVALSVVNTRVSYADLANAVDDYLTSFAACHTGSTATVALGTNNGGDFSAYAATARGRDWANKVVDAVAAPAGVTVVGADDIESNFAGTEMQAQQWESAYLAATAASLLFIGSATGCPTAYGMTKQNCQPVVDDNGVTKTWTQAQYYALAGGASPSRIKALPQIYTPALAVQWANIYATGGHAITFAGALTERAACPTATSPGCVFAALPPAQGWAALWHALSTVVATPSLPVVTDLRVDS